MFSTSGVYLPVPPENFTTTIFDINDPKLQITEIAIPRTYSLFGGEEVVHQHFNLNASTSSLMNNKTEKDRVENFLKVHSTLQHISDISLIQQERRLNCDTICEGWKPSKNDDILAVKQTRAKLQRELVGISTKKSGFLMWLDYSNTNLPAISLLDPKPFHPKNTIEKMLQLSGIDANIDDDDQLELEAPAVAENKRTTPKNILLRGAKEIATTARYVLSDIQSGKINVNDPVGPIGIEWFSSSQITNIEKRYYEDRNTPLKVLQLLAEQYDASSKWTLFPFPELSIEDQLKIENIRQRHQHQIDNASKISASFLVPLGHDTNNRTEILEYGVGKTVLSNARSKQISTIAAKHVMTTEERKRKLDEARGLKSNCNFMSCPNSLTSSVPCSECNKDFCDVHKNHCLHSSAANRTISCNNSNNSNNNYSVENDKGYDDVDLYWNDENFNNKITSQNKKVVKVSKCSTAVKIIEKTNKAGIQISNKANKKIKQIVKKSEKKIKFASLYQTALYDTSGSDNKEDTTTVQVERSIENDNITLLDTLFKKFNSVNMSAELPLVKIWSVIYIEQYEVK